jgi:hypothetical protein
VDQQFASLNAHALGHGEDQPVAPAGADKGQADAGVAAGRLDDGPSGLEYAPLLGIIDHGHGHPVLDAAQRVAGFDLGQQFGPGGQSLEPDQRGVTDRTGEIIADGGVHYLSPSSLPI